MTRKKSDAFFDAYQYLKKHRMFQDGSGFDRFNMACELEVVKVNPETLSVTM